MSNLSFLIMHSLYKIHQYTGRNDHVNDIWFHDVKVIIDTKVHPIYFIGCYCEVRKKIEEC